VAVTAGVFSPEKHSIDCDYGNDREKSIKQLRLSGSKSVSCRDDFGPDPDYGIENPLTRIQIP
jgi:hypothetical protein